MWLILPIPQPDTIDAGSVSYGVSVTTVTPRFSTPFPTKFFEVRAQRF